MTSKETLDLVFSEIMKSLYSVYADYEEIEIDETEDDKGFPVHTAVYGGNLNTKISLTIRTSTGAYYPDAIHSELRFDGINSYSVKDKCFTTKGKVTCPRVSAAVNKLINEIGVGTNTKRIPALRQPTDKSNDFILRFRFKDGTPTLRTIEVVLSLKSADYPLYINGLKHE